MVDQKKEGPFCNSLVITGVEEIQVVSNEMLKDFMGTYHSGAYICLNRPQSAVKKLLVQDGIDVEDIFFIDCISSSLTDVKDEENVMHISNPADLTGLSIAVSEFIKRVPGKKFVLLDALGTLLIYNHGELVIRFIRSILEECAKEEVCITMITPKTEDSSLTDKIIPFFDNIIHKE